MQRIKQSSRRLWIITGMVLSFTFIMGPMHKVHVRTSSPSVDGKLGSITVVSEGEYSRKENVCDEEYSYLGDKDDTVKGSTTNVITQNSLTEAENSDATLANRAIGVKLCFTQCCG